MLDELLFWDTELLIFLNNLGCLAYDELWIIISEKWTWIPLYVALLLALRRHYKKRSLLVVLSLIGICFFFTDFMVSQVYRPLFHRLRPCHVPELVEHLRLVKGSCGGQYGYFSAHASNSFGLAILVGCLLRKQIPRLLPILIFWACVVAYSRVYLGVHYPFDITSGAFYGSVVAYVLYRVFSRFFQ